MFNLTKYLVKERVAVLKLVDTYDIFDPENGRQVGVAVEKPPVWARYLRLVVNKALLPTRVEIGETEGGAPAIVITRGPQFWRATVNVLDASGNLLGYFKSKVLSLGGAFYVFDAQGKQVAEVKGDWKGWNFRFLAGGEEMGTVTKKWAGIGKELFTSADNYMISVNERYAGQSGLMSLLLAAGLAIDIVFKERQ